MSDNKPMSARERIENLLDDNSFVEIGAGISARNTDFNMTSKETPSDGVITGYGVVNDSIVYVYSQDINVLNGSVGEMHAKKISKIYDLALKTGAPVVGMIDCSGLRLQEATDALNAFGEIYLKQVQASGIIPQITAVFGTCGGGAALIPAMADFTLMSEKTAKVFVNSPNALENNDISKCDTSAAAYQAKAGLCDIVASDDAEVITNIRELLSFLPDNNTVDNDSDCTDDLNRENSALASMKNAAAVLTDIADDHRFLELKAESGKEMVIGFLKLDGMTVGAVANCSAVYDAEGNKSEEFALSLTAKGCNKAAEFVSFCDAFSIPVLTLTNVNGFKNCMCSEKKLAKALAKMTYAFSNATCPKVNLITGEAYGSAYVAMNSKSIGADMVYAYPDAKIGMMDSKIAAEIMYPEADAKELSEKASDYEKLQSSVTSAAARGYVDLIVDPADTRKYLVGAFEMLYSKYVYAPEKKHGTK